MGSGIIRCGVQMLAQSPQKWQCVPLAVTLKSQAVIFMSVGQYKVS